MHRHISLGLAMSASALFGAVAVSGLKAQNKSPEAYAGGTIRLVEPREILTSRVFLNRLVSSLIAEPPRDVPKVPQFESRRWCRRPAHLKFSLLLSA
jgi:hypothetical protein